ncbi:MAG: histidine kinase [Eubacteriales bacterium]|nr:histidine kinase [Eubacteriales bacterium]
MRKNRPVKLGKYMIGLLALFLSGQMLLIILFGNLSFFMAQDRESRLMQNMLDVYTHDLRTALNKIDGDLESIIGYTSTLRLLSSRTGLERVKAQQKILTTLQEKCATTQEVDAYAVISSQYPRLLLQRNANISYTEMREISSYIFSAVESEEPQISQWTSTVIGERNYLIRGYRFEQTYIAALLSEDKVRQILAYEEQEGDTTAFYVVDQNDHILFQLGNGGETRNGITLSMCKEELPWANFYEGDEMENAYRIIGRTGGEGIFDFSVLNVVILVIMTSSVLFTLWFSSFTRREILKPINVLAQASREIQRGNLEVRPSYPAGSVEMGEVKTAYNNMLQTILEMKMERYERELEIKDAELKYLHMQLKPHYFLNALSTINSMAYQHQDDNIQIFIQAFSRNIRYMFRVGLHTVRLEEEAENVGDYLQMQRLLYDNCFYEYMDIPEELKDYQVPQMILHTFMENIFKHVISIDSFVTILIRALSEEHEGERMLKLEIHTSSKHFENGILEQINDNKKEEERWKEAPTGGSGGIGLFHTKKILRIMYGRTGLLFLENVEPDGTKVTIWIPERGAM